MGYCIFVCKQKQTYLFDFLPHYFTFSESKWVAQMPLVEFTY
ncbi:TPA: hypothetical protein ACGG3U_000045 [Legionella pneumophila]|nr:MULTISPECIES: hypothetical protein [Legionella]ERB41257.1 hypothetical protein N748_09700 [Legionella pneumophila str. 121004]WBV63980.1 hypothetical protein PGH43_04340 [Legionella pneumophila 130b]AGH53123.1 hypothetical protein LPE509_01032 [Legionella pneumophila subsp. pneumophila LPE509]MCW8389962.1 hypothetical protein [Legionella pneumophila]MCW8394467.1 hypothetical protein [Legionella sp. PATHC039]